MTNEQKKFGLHSKDEPYKKYIGEYYISHPIGANDSYAGKIKEIDITRGKITLNPYFGLNYNRKSGKNLHDLIDRDLDIFTDLTKISFEPTTKKSILYNCYLNNKERAEKSKLKFFKRLKLSWKILFGEEK